jgi:hypothetical protein
VGGIARPVGDIIAQDVIVEVSLCQAPNQLVELRLRITGETGRRERAVVPVIAHYEGLELERLARDGGVHRSATLSVDLEGPAVTPTPHLVLLAAAHEIVLVGIEREQHPEIAIRVDMQNQEVSVVFGAYFDLGFLSREEATIVADPELNGRVVLNRKRGGRRGGLTAQQQRKEQHGDHSTSRNDLGSGVELTTR